MADVNQNIQGPMYRIPAIFQGHTAITAAESTRHGGVSAPPYASLNLGKNTDDDPDMVAENKRRFLSALGFSENQLAWSRQVHGAEVMLVERAGGAEGFDALVTRTPGLLLAVSVADCVPVLLYDPVRQAVAAIHAGWRGAAAAIAQKTLEKMQTHFGTRPADCLAFIGTCIDVCSFEVGEEVAPAFSDKHKRPGDVPGKYFIDLKQVNADQLQEMGVSAANIEVSPYSTVLHNTDYFSHRLEKGVTGRMWGVIGLK